MIYVSDSPNNQESIAAWPDEAGLKEEYDRITKEMEKPLTTKGYDSSSTSKDETVNVKLISNTDINSSLNSLPYISLSAYPLTEFDYLIKDLLPCGCISLIYGDGGMGKSYLALYLAVLVATGKSFLDKDVKRGRVLYCDFELSPELQRQRLEQICKGLGIQHSLLATNLLYIAPGVQENIPNNLTRLIPVIKEDEFSLIIIDSIGAALTGDPEAARDICRLFQQIRELGTVLLLDHQAKRQKGDKARDKTPFGSAYKGHLSRNIWHINAKPGEDNVLNCILRNTKNNFSAKREALGLSFDFSNGALLVSSYEPGLEFAEHLSLKEQILIALDELREATAREIAEETGLELNSVKVTITTLKKEGKVINTGKKKGNASIYSLTVKNKEDLINVNINSQQKSSSETQERESVIETVKSTFNAEEIPEGVPF